MRLSLFGIQHIAFEAQRSVLIHYDKMSEFLVPRCAERI